MRTDYKILREIVEGFSDPQAAPTSDGLAARRPRRPLVCELPDALDPREGGSRPHRSPDYPHDLRRTFERRSSTTDYAPEPLDVEPLLADVRSALIEDAEDWGEDAGVGSLEPFVLLLRPRGGRPGVYRVRPDGVDLLGDPPSPEEIEGMTVQKEFARAGAIVSVAADLDQADAWAGAHGYRHAMARAAAVIYSVHLRSAARGLTGTVFAGLSPSAVRHLLDSDGVSRHQMLAVTIAVPAASAAPARAAPAPARAAPSP